MNNQKSKARLNRARSITETVVIDNLGRLPAQAVDLEEAVVGALLLEKHATVVFDKLRAEDFYVEANKIIYQTCEELYLESKPIDLRTVRARLQKNGLIELVGGAYYLAELSAKVSQSANIQEHASIVKEKAIKRKLTEVSAKILNGSFEDTTDVFELLNDFNTEMDKVSRTFFVGNIRSMKDSAPKQILELMKATPNKELTGVPSGLREVDKATGGWQKTDLIILAARPGMGKTAAIVTACRNAAIDYKKPVAIFSIEMANAQLTNRMLAAEAEIDLNKIIHKNLEEFEKDQLMNKTTKLQTAPIYIDDSPSLSLIELRARARKLVVENGVELIVVDYLQLMKGDQGGNREQEISSISRGLKAIAKDLNVPVIALSQLSRSVEQRGGDKRPMLSDLRESGSIEQDADIVIFLYRPEYYGIEQDADGLPTQGVMEWIVAKFRNGTTGAFVTKFIGKYTKVMDWDTDFTPKPKDVGPVKVPYRDSKEQDDEDLPF